MTPSTDLRVVTESLHKGDLILFPSNTLWCVACDATNVEALNQILALNSFSDSISRNVIVSGDAMLNRIIQSVPDLAWDLFDQSVKPLTLVLPNAKGLPSETLEEDGSLAVQMIQEGWLNKVVHNLGKPLFTAEIQIPRANIPSKFEDLDSRLISAVDYVVDLPFEGSGKPSSKIKLELNGAVKVIRE